MKNTAKTVMTPVMNNPCDIDFKLEELLTNYVPREKLQAVVLDVIRRILVRHAGVAPQSSLHDSFVVTAEDVACLRDSAAIALPPVLCTLMARHRRLRVWHGRT